MTALEKFQLGNKKFSKRTSLKSKVERERIKLMKFSLKNGLSKLVQISHKKRLQTEMKNSYKKRKSMIQNLIWCMKERYTELAENSLRPAEWQASFEAVIRGHSMSTELKKAFYKKLFTSNSILSKQSLDTAGQKSGF